MDRKIPHFLPRNARPLEYALILEPDLERGTYGGQVSIDIHIERDSNSITLNCFDLDIHSTEFKRGGKNILPDPTITYDQLSQQVVVCSDNKTLKAGERVQLKQTFSGILNDQNAGFYRSRYIDEDGNEKWIASTMMQPTSCRRAFPCFDEPDFKATFSLTLLVEHHLMCLGNMSPLAIEDVPWKAKKKVVFNKTPRMSTYLVAFVVADGLYKIRNRDLGIPISIYTRGPNDARKAQLSLELAVKTVDFFGNALAYKYPLSKMDLITVPNFMVGAEENFGLLTFVDFGLLYDSNSQDMFRLYQLVDTVVHEIAHQWFSCLVTTKSWNTTWLNEGFATWLSFYAMERFYPEWKVSRTFAAVDMQNALALDSLRSSHAIELKLEPGQESDVLDAISYIKGASVIRMISDYLGEDRFVAGLQTYVQRHAFGSTVTDDLWSALEDTTGMDVKGVMDPWVKQVGYPVLSVFENNAGIVTIEQNRFLRYRDEKSEEKSEEDESIFAVPLNIRTKTGTKRHILRSIKEQYQLPSDFFKLNADQIGFYRTFYTPNRLEKLASAAREGLLTVEDRNGIVADVGALTSAGYYNSSLLLDLLLGWRNEDDFLVWSTLLAQLSSLRATWMFETPEVNHALDLYQKVLVGSKLDEKGWELEDGDDPNEQRLKVLLFSSAGMAGDCRVINAALAMFSNHFDGLFTIPPILKKSVYAIALRHGGPKQYGMVLDEYLNSPNTETRRIALSSLGHTTEPQLIQKTLNLILSDKVVKPDISTALLPFHTHPRGILAAWQWLKDNWDAILARSPKGGISLIKDVISRAANGLASTGQEKDLRSFFDKKDIRAFRISVEQAIESVHLRAQWTATDREDVAKWLAGRDFVEDTRSNLDTRRLRSMHIELELQ